MAGAVERRLGQQCQVTCEQVRALEQARLLTFLCTTSCQLILRKNLCSMTSFASLGPPPSLGRDKHHQPFRTQHPAWQVLGARLKAQTDRIQSPGPLCSL